MLPLSKEGTFDADVRNAINQNFLEALGVAGNLYIVSNVTYDTNFPYARAKYGSVAYADGSKMFQTNIQAAINACVHYRGDVILVGPRTWVVTAPVLFNKRGIRVQAAFDIGGGQDNGERFTINAGAAANIPAAVISEPCTIAGLGFDSANPATTGWGPTGSPGAVYGGTIAMGAGSGFSGGNFVTLYKCRFTNWGHAGAGIDSWANDLVKVIECDFDGAIDGNGGSANVFAAGVVLSQGHYVTVEDCTFRGCSYAIKHGTPNPANANGSNKHFLYKGNRVIVAAGTEKFIDFNTLATYSQSYGLVADNWLPAATNTASYNDTVANAKIANVAFSGNHYAE